VSAPTSGWGWAGHKQKVPHTRAHYWPASGVSSSRRLSLCDRARAVEGTIVFKSVHPDQRCERCTIRFRRLPLRAAPNVDTPESAAAKGKLARNVGDMAERILGGGAP
jgi:hypothetical protein